MSELTAQAQADATRLNGRTYAPRLAARLMLLGAATAMPLLFVWARVYGDFMYDDAYIAGRFSQNWAFGQGLTWNTGEDPVEGFTSFLWVAIGAGAQRALRLQPHEVMPLVGVLSWVVLVVVVVPLLSGRLVSENGAADAPPAALTLSVVTAVTVAANGLFAFHAFHGLETMLHALVLALLLWLAMDAQSTRRLLMVGGVSFVSVTVRPDAVAFVLPLWGVLYLYAGLTEITARDRGWFSGLRGPASRLYAAAMGVLRIAVAEHVLHQAGYRLSQYRIRQEVLLTFSPIFFFLTFVVGRVGLSVVLRDRVLMLLLIPSLSLCLAYTKMDAILGHGHRFLMVTLPPLVLAAVRGWHLAATFHPAEGSRSSSRRVEAAAFCLIAAVAVLGIFTYRLKASYPELKRYFIAIAEEVEIGKQLEPSSRFWPPPLAAMADVGAIPYFSRLPTIDLIGLANETIAREGLTHSYLLQRQPDLVILQDLYLRKADATGGGVILDIDGEQWTLDLQRYGPRVLIDPSRWRSGGATTFQVVTMPEFSTKYRYVTNYAIGDIDRFYIFVRNEYSQADELTRLLLNSSTPAGGSTNDHE